MMITSKGQVTIPQRIREEMGLVPGCEVEFVIRNGKVVVDKRQPSRRGKLLLSRMRGAATSGMTTEEIMRLTRAQD